MFLEGHFQNAYVTRDIERAKEIVRHQFGVGGEYILFEPDMVLKTPTGEQAAKVKVALAWVGMLQIELIEPVSGFIGHYEDYLPTDPNDAGLRFHHICMRRDDLDAMYAEVEKLGLPVAFEGAVPGVNFLYVDARETLGHYLEYIWSSPEGWEMQGWPAGHPAGR